MSDTPKPRPASRRENAEELRRHAATLRRQAQNGAPGLAVGAMGGSIASAATAIASSPRATGPGLGVGSAGLAETEPDEPGIGPVGLGEYVVEVGDSIASIAKEYGHFWQTIWDDADNAYLQEVRCNPNVLLPGDRVTIPDLRPKDEHGQTEMRHRFRRRGEPSSFKMKVSVVDKPVALRPYTLVFDGMLKFSGTTDADGNITPAPIPSSTRRGELTVDMGADADPLIYDLQVGSLQPKDEVTGIQDRLTNLGFGVLKSGALDYATRDALRKFQEKYELDVTGEPDPATQAKLMEVHRS